jgi:voltage-gated potassium channel
MAETSSWRETAHRVIFGHDTRAGQLFDIALIVAIIVSVLAVMLESVQTIRLQYGSLLIAVEWMLTILFTAEYALRLACVPRPWKYATSFFGFIDLASVLPSYLSLVFPSTHYLLVIRILRVLRVFRILKLVEYVTEADVILEALRHSRRKLAIFIAFVLTVTVILGSVMYMIEAGTPGFSSIPRSIYWTIVTITTVGYGDISPQTPLGQSIASAIMLLGYAIVAVPTGIVTAELAAPRARGAQKRCRACDTTDHARDADFCKRCGGALIR